jgi:hypothetical protein
MDQLSLSLGNKRKIDHQVRVRIGSADLIVSEVFDTYWKFAAERQNIFFKRLRNEFPLTSDSILSLFKFTNAYRASDRVSQYLIREIAYSGEQTHDEIFFRIVLFKMFNKIETWELIRATLGEICYRDFNFDVYDRVLTSALERKSRIYSAAYIMPSGGADGERRKHRSHLKLLQQMMKDQVPEKIANIGSMKRAFELLRSYPMIGDFLAMQFITDLNYSSLTNFDEMEFVVAGPGALDGIRKCFPDADLRGAAEIIRFMSESQDEQFGRRGIRFDSLWGRRLQLIDCQNLFCEVDKYSRQAHPDVPGRSGRTRIKQQFVANPQRLSLFYPPKWSLNYKIPVAYKDVSSLRRNTEVLELSGA